MSRHYLDHASTSPLRDCARVAFDEALALQESASIGDPGRIHHEGMHARALLEHARSQVAHLLSAKQREIVFTSGATESIATAVWGAVRRSVDAGRVPRIVHSSVEHSAVRRSSEQFAQALGGSVTIVGVDSTGRIDVEAFLEQLTSETAMAHVQWGNHEVGTLQPVEEIAAACRDRNILLHVDAAQAVGRIPITPSDLGIDLLSFSSHKFGGPAGIGALWIRQGLRIEPLINGGEQERARRAGLENIPAALAFGAAAEELANGQLEREATAARNAIATAIERVTTIDGVSLLGSEDPDQRLPHLACVAVEGVEPQGVVLGLDRRGIALHSGSSCASEGLEPSPVLEAMGVDAHRSLRISVGHSTTSDDIEALCDALPAVVTELRSLQT